MSFLKTVLVAVLFVTMAFGQVVSTPKAVAIDKVATRLDAAQAKSTWERVAPELRQMREARANNSPGNFFLNQAPGVMEVIGSSNSDNPIAVRFQSFGSLEPNSTVAFQMFLPDGTQVPMSAWKIGMNPDGSGWSVYEELWNGKFPNAWQGGETIFGVVVISPSGRVSYTSATVEVFACCILSGPLTRADVSADGLSVTITGFFPLNTYATVSGTPVTVNFSRVIPIVVPTSGTIDLSQFGQGQQLSLTVCSQGSCSTRQLYLTGNGGKG